MARRSSCGCTSLAFLAIVLALVFLMPGRSSTPSVQAVSPTTLPAVTPMVESVVSPTIAADPRTMLGQIARDQFAGNLRSASLGTTVDSIAVIDYDLPPGESDPALIVATTSQDLIALAPRAFALPTVGTLILRPFTDINGQQNVALTFRVARATARGIDWAQVDPHHLGLLLSGASSVTVRPDLQQAWTTFNR